MICLLCLPKTLRKDLSLIKGNSRIAFSTKNKVSMVRHLRRVHYIKPSFKDLDSDGTSFISRILSMLGEVEEEEHQRMEMITFKMERDLLKRFNEFVREHGGNRSYWIRRIINEYISKRGY